MSSLNKKNVNGSVTPRDVSVAIPSSALKIAMNLNSNDTTPVGEKQGWYQMTGYSDKIYDFIAKFRNRETLVDSLSHTY